MSHAILEFTQMSQSSALHFFYKTASELLIWIVIPFFAVHQRVTCIFLEVFYLSLKCASWKFRVTEQESANTSCRKGNSYQIYRENSFSEGNQIYRISWTVCPWKWTSLSKAMDSQARNYIRWLPVVPINVNYSIIPLKVKRNCLKPDLI